MKNFWRIQNIKWFHAPPKKCTCEFCLFFIAGPLPLVSVSQKETCSLRVDRTHLQLFTLRRLCCAVSLCLWASLHKCNSCLLSNFALTRRMERCLCKRNVTAGPGVYVLRFLWRNDKFYDVKTNVKSWHLKVRSHDLCMCNALAYVRRPGQPVNMSMHINFPFHLPSSFLQHLVSKTNSGRQTQSMLVTTRPAQMVAEQAKQHQMNIKRCVQSHCVTTLSLGIFISWRPEVVKDVLGVCCDVYAVQKYIK